MFVYAIKSIEKNYIYVWMTNDLERRLSDHNNWKNLSTKHYCPFKLIYSEIVENTIEWRKREKYFKSWYWKSVLIKIVNTSTSAIGW